MGDFMIIVHGCMYEDRILEKLSKIDQKLEEHDQRFSNIEKLLIKYDERFDSIDRRFEAMDQKFESIDRRFELIDQRFEKIENKLEEHDQQFSELHEELEFIRDHAVPREEFFGVIVQMVTKAEFKEEFKNYATKDDLKEMWSNLQETLDAHTVILKRLDQERVFTNKRIARIEDDLNRVKIHVNLT